MSSSFKHTLLVAFSICFVASILVSTAAVVLKPVQEYNKKLDLLKNILIVGDIYKDGADINKIYKEKISPEIIDLKTGNIVSKDKYDKIVNLNDFDILKAANSNTWGERIPADKDIAKIKRMPKVMIVYRVMGKEGVEQYILPIYGKGLWSTMFAFISLDKDLHTIKGISFYDQGETPGLGGEVENPRWKKIWVGKQAYDLKGNLKIRVIKRKVDRNSPNAKYEVDGLSGATLTTRGVNNLVRFWLGDDGYGAFIKKLHGEVNENL
ncbi:Na(+)-translocating NADH-quinone reductase subunit C [bacterium BMS3Abin04]|nr:Na(+)-translocating NADH-quinone reductase subunit C [bacterium BMS3Abin04]